MFSGANFDIFFRYTEFCTKFAESYMVGVVPLSKVKRRLRSAALFGNSAPGLSRLNNTPDPSEGASFKLWKRERAEDCWGSITAEVSSCR